MNGRYIDATIKAEIKRAKRDGREINRCHLKNETGLTWAQLNSAFVRLARQTVESESIVARRK